MEKELTTTTALQQVVYKTEKGTPVTDSVKVAEVFGKMHKNVLKSIRNILGSAQNLAHKTWFHQVTYIDGQRKTQPMFLMNRDGFSLLAMSLTGERALQFKVGFIQQFDMMEQALKEVATATPAIPQTFAQALRLAAEQAETIEAQQKQLAEQINIQPNSVQRLKYGTAQPSLKTITAIADYFDVSIDYLVGRTDNPEINK